MKSDDDDYGSLSSADLCPARSTTPCPPVSGLIESLSTMEVTSIANKQNFRCDEEHEFSGGAPQQYPPPAHPECVLPRNLRSERRIEYDAAEYPFPELVVGVQAPS